MQICCRVLATWSHGKYCTSIKPSVHDIPGYINYIQYAFALQGKVFYHKPWAAISVDADWHSSDILKFIESNIHQQLIHYVVILPHGMSFSWHIYIIYLTPTIFNCVFSNNNNSNNNNNYNIAGIVWVINSWYVAQQRSDRNIISHQVIAIKTEQVHKIESLMFIFWQGWSSWNKSLFCTQNQKCNHLKKPGLVSHLPHKQS